MGLIKTVFMTELLMGLKIVFMQMFKPYCTLQYPHVKHPIPDGYRGLMSLLRYEDGSERCVGCSLCEAACPSNCIKVVSDEVPGQPLVRYAREYYLDISRCVFCGFCTEACPVDALAMTKVYEASVYDRRELMFDKRKLYALGEQFLEDGKAYLVAHGMDDGTLYPREGLGDNRYAFPPVDTAHGGEQPEQIGLTREALEVEEIR
ncbi:MAG: NADH-quinone oxidoreductase subunit NuoI [Nitrospirota bacterium]|nr:NADH-quinone oxidoreductase subunit NuoI [Nitrospirota bacterium]